MLIHREEQQALNAFFETLKLKIPFQAGNTNPNKSAKIEQILAYLEIMHAQIRKYSKKRDLIFIESGAGNCYLSFLVYYFYTKLDNRPVRIHCLDINQRLMEKNRQLAQILEFDQMWFHACDIADYTHPEPVDMVYALHACDAATDKALLLGLKTNARHILSVSCCQHTLKKHLKSRPYTGMTRHRVFKEKLAYMVGDSLRALLLEMQGYKVDILEFVSSRYTDKNILVRAQKGAAHNRHKLLEEYFRLQQAFQIRPSLEQYLRQENIMPESAIVHTPDRNVGVEELHANERAVQSV